MFGECSTINCENYRQKGDSIFCVVHRRFWKDYCRSVKITNEDISDRDLEMNLQYFQLKANENSIKELR